MPDGSYFRDDGETVPGASGAEKARSYAVFEALTPPE